MRLIRWFLCLPAAFAASVAFGALAWWITHFFGGSTWYSWSSSGAASAVSFFFVAFKVAPRATPHLKWISVLIVGGLGTISALGVLMSGNEIVSSLAGLVMLGTAVYYARRPVTEIQTDVARL